MGDIHHYHPLLLILPPKWNKSLFKVSVYSARITWREGSVGSFVVSVLIWRLVAVESISSGELPHLVVQADFLIKFICASFYLASYLFLCFVVTLRQSSSMTSVMYIPGKESGLCLHLPFTPGVLVMRNILWTFIYLSTILISWTGSTVRVLMAPYKTSLSRRLRENLILPFGRAP